MTSNAVVEGMISISGHIAHALFDLRATHSFISSAFAYKLNQVSEPKISVGCIHTDRGKDNS